MQESKQDRLPNPHDIISQPGWSIIGRNREQENLIFREMQPAIAKQPKNTHKLYKLLSAIALDQDCKAFIDENTLDQTDRVLGMDYDRTPLQWAAVHGNLKATEALLQKGAQNTGQNRSAIYLACIYANPKNIENTIQVVKQLLRNGFFCTKAALEAAITRGHTKLIHALLEGIDAAKISSKELLTQAMQANQFEIANLLLTHTSIDPNTQFTFSINGIKYVGTALHMVRGLLPSPDTAAANLLQTLENHKRINKNAKTSWHFNGTGLATRGLTADQIADKNIKLSTSSEGALLGLFSNRESQETEKKSPHTVKFYMPPKYKASKSKNEENPPKDGEHWTVTSMGNGLNKKG